MRMGGLSTTRRSDEIGDRVKEEIGGRTIPEHYKQAGELSIENWSWDRVVVYTVVQLQI